LERGDAKRAMVEAGRAKALAPRAPAVREINGLALYQQGRWQEALSELQAYRRLSGRQDQNHVIADCLRALDRPADVVPLAEAALRDPSVQAERKAEAAIVAAAALADQGRYPEALAFLGRFRTKADVAAGPSLRLWYVRGDILERAGRRREAAQEFQKVVRQDPTAFDAAERLAHLAS
jgi:tetratricopeptide (TPR) repeat protein